MKLASTNSNVFSATSNVTGSTDCRILRNNIIRFEDACYDPVYRWYVSLVLIAIMLVFAYLFLLCLWLGLGKGEDKPKKDKPRKPVQDTVEDDVVDINDNEKIPISWLK